MTDKITQRILGEAREKAEDIKSEAAASYDAVIAAAREKASEILKKAELDAKASLPDAERRFGAVAELDAKKYRLSAKIQVLDEAFSQAEEAFLALDADKYREIYRGIVLSAVSTGREGIAPGADETRLGAEFVASVNDALKAQGKVAEVTLLPQREDIKGGLVVSEGSMEINLSTAAVMRQVREEIEGKTAELLFGQEEA